jgi:PIN domain nuclease of toxin-antitoxin system
MQAKNKVLFDASALLALIKKEPGYKQLEDLLASSCISAVNLSEVVSVLMRVGIPQNKIEEIVTEIIPEIIPFTYRTGLVTGNLIAKTKEFGLSLGDRACIATGIVENMVIYTTDKIWQKLQLDNLTIVIIR